MAHQRLSRPRRRLVVAVAGALALSGLTVTHQVAQAAPTQASVAQKHARVELPAKRTASSKTYRNADGSRTTELFAEPINYRDGRDWKPISSKLVPANQEGYAWKNEANSFGAAFKDRLTTGYLRLSVGDRAFDVNVDGAAESTADVGDSSSRVTYADAFTDADLRYDVGATGIKETVVMGSAAAPTHYRFVITSKDAQDLDAKKDRSGSWTVTDERSPDPLFVLDAPSVTEGAGDHVVGVPSRDPVSMKVANVDGALAVDVDVDPAWLAAPGRQFPVLLDPTVTLQPTSEDASFHVNCGNCIPETGDRIYIGASDTQVLRGAVSFDLGQLPSDAVVSAATFQAYWDRWCLTAATTCSSVNQQIDLHQMTSPWSLSTTSSQVGFNATPIGSVSLPAGTPDQWMSWNVTNTVKAWASGSTPNYGFLLKKSVETLGSSGPVPPGRRYSEPTLSPKLQITYTTDAVDLFDPQTLHSNGADLAWSQYTGAITGAPFVEYQIHRSNSSSFTPSASTLLATIKDVTKTTFRDTTAGPSKTYTYKVTVNGQQSNARTVTLPADGQAAKVLQPTPAGGKSTFVGYVNNLTNCANYGVDADLSAGTDVSGSSSRIWRSLLQFDLSDVPSGSSITGATLSLWETSSAGTPGTLDVHRVTRAWREGTGNSTCSNDGATWYSADGVSAWTNSGGDYEATPSASTTAAGPGTWNAFNLTNLVSRWTSGQATNLGMLVKTRSEALGANNIAFFNSDDFTSSPTLRPKLAVNYADGSHAIAPTVALTSPAAGANVHGAVTLTADATDDRRVEQVTFLRDGVAISTDTSAPFEATWATTMSDNGSHQLTARATDDAGNVTTSSAVAVTVQNSNPPTVSMTAPAPGATVAGTVNLTANATDDIQVSQVEFFVDGVRIGAADTTAPYAVSWNSLDPAQPFYDGTHQVTARATDNHGQSTDSTAVSVTLANTAGTRYVANWSSSAVPQMMTYDPALTTQLNQGVSVTVTNATAQTWNSADVVLRYRWLRQDGSLVSTGPDLSLGSDLRAGRSKTVSVLVQPPTLTDGVERAQYLLQFDLYEKSTASYFGAHGNLPLTNPVIVNKAIKAAALGLEHYYDYEPEAVGGGMTQLTNVASGNSLLQWSLSSSPGRGLSTVAGLTYNSLEDHSESPVGNNFSLAISGLTRLGLPLDIHPNNADQIAGRSNKYIELVDGDGTTLRFTGNAAGGWDEPAGVHLYLRAYSSTDTTKAWALTRPDRVTYFYDQSGFPTSIQDKNGNQLKFTYENVPAGEDPGGVKKRITTITDPAGNDATPASGRTYTIDYYSKAEAPKPQMRGKIEQITDHNGSKIHFDYYEDGNLLRITEVGGTTADGLTAPDRDVTFTYTTSDGSAAAIPLASDRANPDPKTPNQSSRLFSVRDPRGKETTFAYYGPTSGQLRWKLKSRTNRTGDTTDFGYDLTTRTTTVTAPLSRVTKYAYDTDGKVTAVTDPKNQITGYEWSSDRQVTKVTEPTGKYTEYRYNDNGYLTDRWDQLRDHTTLTYENVAVDTNDTSTRWKAGRTIAHISQLKTKTNPRGTATATPTDDYQWTFGYDTKGNLATVTQPEGSPQYTTTYTYNANGTLATSVDPNQQTTTYSSYDANGLLTKVVDANSHTTTFGYDGDGHLIWVQDPRHASATGGDPHTYRTYSYYDALGRLRRQSTPKSTAEAAPLIWAATDYDRNDNVTANFDPEYGFSFVAGPKTAVTYDDMDRPTSVTNPDNETTTSTYDAAGRTTSVTTPKGAATANTQDYATFYDYDALDRIVRQTRYDTSTTPAHALITHGCYSLAGDLVSVTMPNADVATVNCASPPGFTKRYTYDDAHQLKTSTDALNHQTSYGYDADGNVSSVTDATGHTTTSDHDARSLVTRTVENLTSTRSLTTLFSYDGTGRLVRQVSPRGYDASPDKSTFTDFVTRYSYDPVGQLTRIDEPTKGAETKTYIHRGYDANGNLTTTTLPDAATTLAGVPQEKITTTTYFDTGWIEDTRDHVNPEASYDYNARGQQTLHRAGTTVPELWDYAADGMLSSHHDRQVDGNGGQAVTYTYDANNQLRTALEGAGITTPNAKPVEVDLSYDTLDRLQKSRFRDQGATNYTFTSFGYDLDGNTVDRRDDGVETPAGALVTAGTRHRYTYDQADWLSTQEDFQSDGCQKITNTFTATGQEDSRTIRKATQDCDANPSFTIKQSTAWTYYENHKLKTLTTRAGALDTGTLRESHSVDYVDGTGAYVNGNRTSDTFTQKGPNSECNATTCTSTFTYNGRDLLTKEQRTPGPTISYTLDDIGNVRTKDTGNGHPTFFDYTGTQLSTMAIDTPGNLVAKYLYDAEGKQKCVIVATYTGTCATATAANLRATYDYDYLNRLSAYRSYANGAVSDNTTYEYDPLDRVTKETEKHPNTPQRVTSFTYLGLTNLVTKEAQTGDPTKDATKTYSYDAFGHRISLTNTPTDTTKPAETDTYGYDVHGSVSMLLTSSGQAKATYGYDAYGQPDQALTVGDPQNNNPLNPYRYTGKRWDTGSNTLDMGARRFGPDTTRFLQPDQYGGALANLSLSNDPLTGNRYSLAGGNPVSFIESDGHNLIDAGGGGGASSTPSPSTSSTPGSSVGTFIGTEASVEHHMEVRKQMNDAAEWGYEFPRDVARQEEEWSGASFVAPPSGPTLLDVGKAIVTSIPRHASGCADHDMSDCGALWLDLFLAAVPEGRAGAVTRGLDSGANGVRVANGGAAAVRLGQAGEAAVRSAYNIGPKATRVINGRTRIFDGLNSTAVSEVKNVQSLSYTQQLRDYADYAQKNGLRLDIYVRRGTTLSGPLRSADMDPFSPVNILPVLP